jgi:5-methylcytosine-specific restriction enzyme A
MTEPHNRLYDSVRWRSARAAFLSAHPLCAMCAKVGRDKAATTVHHTEKHNGDPVIFWDQSKWAAVCSECHSGWVRVQENSGTLPGCDINGLPLDPRSPWAAKEKKL